MENWIARVEVDELLAGIAALVRRRELLRVGGAGEHELERNRIELERLRWRLARAARESALADGPQAA